MSKGVVWAVLRRPSLWGTAMVQLARLAPTGWWKRWPFLPRPSADYLDFRYVTQYGGQHGAPQAPVRVEDVLDYLRWCKEWNRTR
jgi:hypothetical protein